MPDNRPGTLRRLFGGFWQAVDVTRRFVINAVFLLIVILIGIAWLAGSSHLRLQSDTALVLNIKGDIVEEFTGSAREAELAESLGGEARETQLRDLLAVIDAAAKDAKIARMVLVLDDMGHAGMAKLRELARAVERFKATGKQVVAWSSTMDQRRYFLAVHANEVYVHPMGAVFLTGFGGYRNYYHDALDRLGVTVNVFRVGKFKSAVEPFTGNGPSPEAAEAEAYWLKDAWSSYTNEVERARHLPSGTIAALIADAPARLAAVDGDQARLALNEKLVDGLKTRDEMRALMIERGKPDEEHKTFRQIGFEDYRAEVAEPGDRSRQIGVIVAEGTISDGNEAQGSIGGRSTSERIRKAREDDAIKALVLRVDSGGGSAFGSELIRRELELTRKAGKPVVVSMSDVAASGGYLISMAADRVLADPATITGSIGVFGLLPTVDRSLDKLGVHTGGSTTTWLAGVPDLRRPVDPRLAQIFQNSTEHFYRQFIGVVAQARQISSEQVNEVAQGRVWTGAQARERGLIDDLGGLDAAIGAAGALAKLGENYRVTYVEAEPKGWARILASLPSAALRSAASDLVLRMLGETASRSMVAGLGSDLLRLTASADAAGIPQTYAHCLCVAP
jgi:protease-4